MIRIVVAAAFLFCTGNVAHAQTQHPCAPDAAAKAHLLLKHHFFDSEGEKIHSYSIGVAVKTLPPIRALKGNGRFDVLEIWGYIYKAEYRMRFIYAQLKGSCLLMGQEILEASDPY